MNLNENTKLYMLKVLDEKNNQDSSVFSNLKNYKKYYLKEITAPGLRTPPYQGRKPVDPLAGKSPDQSGGITPTIGSSTTINYGRENANNLTKTNFGGGAGQGMKSGTPARRTDPIGQIFGETDPLVSAGAYGAGKAADLAGGILGRLGISTAAGSNFLSKLGAGLGNLGLDIGRKVLGQFSQIAGTDIIDANTARIAQKNVSDVISASGHGSAGIFVPGAREYEKLQTPKDVSIEERKRKVEMAKLEREEQALGLSP